MEWPHHAKAGSRDPGDKGAIGEFVRSPPLLWIDQLSLCTLASYDASHHPDRVMSRTSPVRARVRSAGRERTGSEVPPPARVPCPAVRAGRRDLPSRPSPQGLASEQTLRASPSGLRRWIRCRSEDRWLGLVPGPSGPAGRWPPQLNPWGQRGPQRHCRHSLTVPWPP